MSPFKKCEASSAKGSKRCNLIKMQGSFNPGGGATAGPWEDWVISTPDSSPKDSNISVFFFFFFCCPYLLPAWVKNDDSKSAYRCGYDHERRKRVAFDWNIALVLVREACSNVIYNIYNIPVTLLAVYTPTDHGYDHICTCHRLCTIFDINITCGWPDFQGCETS